MGSERTGKGKSTLNRIEDSAEEARGECKNILYKNSLCVLHSGASFVEIMVQTLLVYCQTFGLYAL